MQRSLRSILITLHASAAILALTIACFSEHRAVTESVGEGSCLLPQTPDVDGSTIIAISGYAFHPAQVHVRRGERVTWVNCESGSAPSHTSSADGSTWTSGLIAPGATFTRTFDAPGTFAYHCEPHPFMMGTVVVD